MKLNRIAPLLLLALAAPAYAADNAAVLANYGKHCASCHGKDGKGLTTMGKKVGCKDYTDAKIVAEIKDDEAHKKVKDGMKDKAGKELMKPFNAKLKDDEIKDLIAYMKAFAKK